MKKESFRGEPQFQLVLLNGQELPREKDGKDTVSEKNNVHESIEM